MSKKRADRVRVLVARTPGGPWLTVSARRTCDVTTPHELLVALRGAVTEWVRNNYDGRELWKSCDRDLNIGDLCSYLGDDFKSDKRLAAEMHEAGIRGLKIHSVDCSPEWHYDTVLVTRDSSQV